MYSPQYDTPPPPSQFRRPWSPDPYDSLPSISQGRSNQPYNDTYFHNYDYDSDVPQPSYRRQQRREASEVSVEALDLADYAMTLRGNRNGNVLYNYPEDLHPPSHISHHPQSRHSTQPPSLSRGDTLSSNTHSARSSRRPFSLPPPHSHSSPSHRTTSPPSAYSRYPKFADPRFSQPPDQASDAGIDIGQFPSWSHNWYNKAKDSSSPPPDIYTSLPKSHSARSPFDPGNDAHHYGYSQDFLYSSDPYGSGSVGHESSRNLVPWSNDPRDYGPSVDSAMKEERIRMLEREFGPNAKSKRSSGNSFVDENGKPLVGTVNEKGQLVTQGPRKRIAVRVFQMILALGAAIPSIYAALVIKVKGTETPPPSGKPATYVLYIFSIITFLFLVFLFMIYPCCCGRRNKTAAQSNPLGNGMVVLPVQGLPGGKKGGKGKAGKKGKKGGQNQGPGDVQVNLIVDPSAFRQDEPETTDEEDEDWDGSMPGGYGSSRNKRRRTPKRRSVFAGLQMEQQWKVARAWMKKVTFFDVFALIIWGAIFVLIMLGPRCPAGTFDGWCTAYNTSTAAACLLCVAFAFSLFFDVKDLNSSKVSPRTRT